MRMRFEPWMLGMMEERGYMDTKESHINRVARYIAQNIHGEVDRATFERVCIACKIDPRSFDQQDLNVLQRKLDALTGH